MTFEEISREVPAFLQLGDQPERGSRTGMKADTSMAEMRTPSRELKERLARGLANSLLPFFRRYPYRGPCSIFHLNVRGAYSPIDGLFYNRIPKAANTTVSGILAENSSYHRPFSGNRDKARMLRPAFMSRSQVDSLSTDAVFTFTVVRNPYARVLSAYQDKFLRGKPQLRRYASMMNCPDGQVPDFVEFCRFLDRGGLYLDAHWAPQSCLMLLPVPEFDLVAKVETLDRDMATIMNRIWGITPTEKLKKAGTSTGADGKLRAQYTDEAKDIVDRLYAGDFDAFGYEPTL